MFSFTVRFSEYKVYLNFQQIFERFHGFVENTFQRQIFNYVYLETLTSNKMRIIPIINLEEKRIRNCKIPVIILEGKQNKVK